MITKDEFIEIKNNYLEKYPEHCYVFITKYLPEKLLIITDYYYSSYDCARRGIIEITKRNINYYGISGKIIKEDYFCSRIYSGYPFTIEGRRGKDLINFFFSKPNTTSVPIITLRSILKNWFKEIIRELKRNKIQISNVYKFCSHDYYSIYRNASLKKVKTLILQGRLIQNLFEVSPKDLRYLVENYPVDLPYYRDYVLNLKNIFNQSIKDISKYIKVYTLGTCIIFEDTDDVSKKKRDIIYSYNLSQQDFGLLYIYRDYIRCLNQLPKEIKKSYPRYPSFERIHKLHDEIITLINKEADRIAELKNKEKQEKYIKYFYKEAKKFEMSNDTYSIIAVENLMDLVKEGRILNHCVGSYINSVSNGNEYILFLRKNDNINVPFFTIDIDSNNHVRQIHGRCNCNITNEIKPFIKEWANKFKLNISNCSGMYCALG